MQITIPDAALRDAVQTVCHAVRDTGGKAFLVGGCVRDALLGRAVKDIDIEVFGLEQEKVRNLLGRYFKVDLVGESFSVFKLGGLPVDVALPRRESKTGLGHKAFDVVVDPVLSFEDAAARRDFTINAMLFDPLEQSLVDPFHGQADLEAHVLRHTSDRFVEDPLRVLRGMQFAARFTLTLAAETVDICRTMGMEGLPPERLFEEWKKLVLLGERPSGGLEFLRATGWLRYYPELTALVGCEQEPEWHPEGDVWVHTLKCMDAFALERVGDEWEDLVVGLAVLCHDFGKPATTKHEDGRLRSRGHETEGEVPTRTFLGRLTNQADLVDEVVALVVTHLRPKELFESNAGDSAVRRLARQVKRIDRLVRVAQADRKGVKDYDGDAFPAGEWLLAKAKSLEVVDSKPKPIVMGRHLLETGMKPGPDMGRILDALYEQQLDGKFATLEEGLAIAKQLKT